MRRRSILWQERRKASEPRPPPPPLEKEGIPMGLGDVPAYSDEPEILLECSRCKRLGRHYKKKTSEFYPCTQNKTRGFHYNCKKCHKEVGEEYRKKQPGKQAEEPPTEEAPTPVTPPRIRKPQEPKKSTYKNRTLEDVVLILGMHQPIGSEVRELHHWLNKIIEEQLNLFHQSRMTTPAGKVRARKFVETALFEISRELMRLNRNLEKTREDENYRAKAQIIPKSTEKMKALALLGLGPGASKMEIRSAYRRKARDTHPDVGGSTEQMQQLNAAHRILTEKMDGSDDTGKGTQAQKDQDNQRDSSGADPGRAEAQAPAQ